MLRLALAATLLAGMPVVLQAQDSASKTTPAAHQVAPVVHGTVTDSAGMLLSDVTVWAQSEAHDSIGVRTGADGRFRLFGLQANVPYVFTARRIGYAAGISKPLRFAATDTVEINFVLDPTVARLPAVHIHAMPIPEYHLTAAQIAKAGYADALTAIVFMRPRMLGDGFKNCQLDTSVYTYGSTIGWPKPPRSMAMAGTGYDFRLFVNGVWHGEQGAKDLLSQIPAENIQEMRYVDCWDQNTPEFRNSLMVVLKPGVKF